MKKLLFCLALSVAFLSSCSTMRTATSKSVDVSTSISSVTTADLAVAQQRVEYDYIPSRKERKKMKLAVMQEKAVAAALKNNGNADVMVATEYQVERKGFKIRKVTVSGYPAKYKNFKTL
ncbi:MAG: hypothetical protein R3Y44_06240 [Rikenellaceae bacterium]